jgi:hypothetical protein
MLAIKAKIHVSPMITDNFILIRSEHDRDRLEAIAPCLFALAMFKAVKANATTSNNFSAASGAAKKIIRPYLEEIQHTFFPYSGLKEISSISIQKSNITADVTTPKGVNQAYRLYFINLLLFRLDPLDMEVLENVNNKSRTITFIQQKAARKK